LRSNIWTLIALVVLVNCANRGRPDGGPKDEEPPVIVSSNPANYTTNFKATEIRITFNEFIKVKDLQKQLIISPPMEWDPEIAPLGTASRDIRIKIKDTLPPNTTYAFNFGNSIVDNNEENPYPYFRYVFSTGPTIDSLSVQGMVIDAYEREPDTYISVMLYEADSSYTDSIVYKSRPRYITNTLDSIKVFSIDNLKAGRYKLVAMKDQNTNYLFNPEEDKIGFTEGFIEVPKDTLYRIKVFKEDLPFEVGRPKQVGETRILFPFTGKFEEVDITMLDSVPNELEYRIIKDRKTDSLYYWYKPKLELDSTRFRVVSGNYADTLAYKFRGADKDSLLISPYISGSINFDQNFTIEGLTPFENLDTTLVKMINRDSLLVSYGAKLDTLMNRYEFPIALEPNQRYSVQMLPGAITDFYGSVNDTLQFTFSTKGKADYGNLRLNVKNGQLPMIVQLVNERGEVKYEKVARLSSTVDFTDIIPGNYYKRVIFDTNYNGVWDTGNFLKGIQPERISYDRDLEEIRANFDYVLEFNLLNETNPDPPEN
jgi:uncharacterized protein (DUF2141 family)